MLSCIIVGIIYNFKYAIFYLIKCCIEADDIFNFNLWYETPKSKELITSSKSNTSFTFADEQCSGLFFIINENRANVHWNQPDNLIFSSVFRKSKIININCIDCKLS